MKRILFYALVAIITTIRIAHATNVSGVIATNATWTPAGSPYIVVGDITIDSGYTLTIQPGVQVLVDGNYNFYVDGKLIAVGTITDSIRFTSNKTTPAMVNWRGISLRVKGKNDTSIIKYTYVEHAYRGVFSDGCSPKISNSVFRRNGTGIFINFSPGYPLIKNNFFTLNSTGIQGGSTFTAAPSGEISGNDFTNNADGIVSVNTTAWKITGNNVNYNHNGINIAGLTTNCDISGNTIIGNDNFGLNFSAGGLLTFPLQNNLIIYNGRGIVMNNLRGVISNNTISYNGIGVQQTWTTTTASNFSFQYNCVTNSNTHNFETLSSISTPNVTVANNWWGTTTTSTIDSAILDYYDNLTLNKVLYTPVLTQPDASCQSVSPPPTCSAPTAISFSPSTLTSGITSWQGVPGATNYEYYVALSPSTPPSVATSTTNTSINLTGLQNNTLYDFCVRTRCSGNPIPSAWTCDTFRIQPPVCPPPVAIHKNFVGDDSATFSWDTVASATAYEYYIAPSPSSPPATATATNNPIVFVNGLSQGITYDICVRTNCGNLFSAWICDTITTTTEGINKISGNHIRSYPNPVKRSFTIEADVSFYNADIIVTNLLGATLYTGKINGTKQAIDMSFYPEGMYFLKCVTEKGSQTIKLLKE